MNERLRTAGSVGLAIAVGAGLVSDYYARDPLFLPQLAIDFISDNGCRLKTNGEDTLDLNFPEKNEIKTEEQLHAFAKETAERLGLTLVEESGHIKRINSATTPDEVLDELNSYATGHSINFSIPRYYKPIDLPVRFNSFTSDPELDEFKKNVSSFVKDLYYMPVELTKIADIREFKIVKDLYLDADLTSFLNNDRAAGKYNIVNGIIYVDPSNPNKKFSKVATHEISHAIDISLCGVFGALNDRQLERINPPDFSYGNLEIRFPEVTYSQNGQANAAEDKAYIASELILPYLKKPVEEIPLVLQRKILLIIGRVGEKVPNYPPYWKEISEVASGINGNIEA